MLTFDQGVDLLASDVQGVVGFLLTFDQSVDLLAMGFDLLALGGQLLGHGVLPLGHGVLLARHGVLPREHDVLLARHGVLSRGHGLQRLGQCVHTLGGGAVVFFLPRHVLREQVKGALGDVLDDDQAAVGFANSGH